MNPKTPINIEQHQFKISLSFSGKDRQKYIEPVAKILWDELGEHSVLYDKCYDAVLAYPNAGFSLAKLYRDNSDLVVVFLSKGYQKSEWCGLEWRYIQGLIQKKLFKKIMLIRLDGIDIEQVDGLVAGDYCLDFNVHSFDPRKCVDKILYRYRCTSDENGKIDGTDPNEGFEKSDEIPDDISDQDRAKESAAILKFVKQRLDSVLNDGQAVTEQLRELLGVDKDSDVVSLLCDRAKEDLPNAMTLLCKATRNALTHLKLNQQFDLTPTIQCGQETLNWLVLFAVDPAWLCRHRGVFSKDTDSVSAFVSADSPFSANAGVSAAQETQPAPMRLVGPFDVEIQGTVDIDNILEPGPGLDSRLEEIKKVLWTTYWETKIVNSKLRSNFAAPKFFSRDPTNPNNSQLNKLILDKRAAGGQDHYCITSLKIEKNEFAKQVLDGLLRDLPDLNVVVFKEDGNTTVLAFLEDDLISKFHTMEDIFGEFV